MTQKTIMICAGGTGGHMFPALSLAQDLLSRECQVVILTDHRAEKYIQGFDERLKTHIISSATLPSGLLGKIKGALSLGKGYLQARSLIKKYKPHLVIGFGGYPSIPPMVAAQRANILTVIHEANAVLGRANAYLAPKADRIALSLPNLSSLQEADAVRAIVTGNPVRLEIASLYSHPYNTPDEGASFNMTIVGGSLGAKVMAEVIPPALASLPEEHKVRLNVTQQCHEEDIVTVQKIYADQGITANLMPFIEDMAEVLKNTHLIVARSGASTVSEIAVAGIPAIFIPYPHHADQQQKINAETVSGAGGAWVMEEKDLSSEKMANKIAELMGSPESLFRAADAMRSCAKPEATRKLGNLVVALIKGWDKEVSKPYDYTQGRQG